MGFCSDRPECEGFVIALVPRDLPTVLEGDCIRYASVGCACGWRSRIQLVPLGTSWSPHMLWLDGEARERAHDLWSAEHDRRPEVRRCVLLRPERVTRRA